MAVEYKSAAEEIEAMLNGRHESEETEDDTTNSGSEIEEDFEEDDTNQDGLDAEDSNDEGNDDAEDTDGQDEEEESEEEDLETKDQNDGSDADTKDEDEDEADKSDEEDSQEEDGDKTEDKDAETEDKNDGSNPATATIDPEEFAKLKSFYEKVTGEFKANGKTIKGFNDPEKIVQGLQKAIGFEEKNAAINKHKKFLTPLKERGFLDNPEKFNLALSIIDGDKEAIKEHLKALEINPVLDLDLDDIHYKQKQHLPSDGKVILDEAFESAEAYGVKDKLSEVLGTDFDDDSFQDFIKYPKLRSDLIEHIQDGTYELVKNRIDEIRLTDISGDFKSTKVVDQYRYALDALGRELADQKASKSTIEDEKTDDIIDKATIKNTADNIMSQAVTLDEKRKAEILAEEEEKFRAEAAKIAADKARKEAASVSKTKAPAKSSDKKEEFDPLKIESSDEFRKYFDSLIR